MFTVKKTTFPTCFTASVAGNVVQDFWRRVQNELSKLGGGTLCPSAVLSPAEWNVYVMASMPVLDGEVSLRMNDIYQEVLQKG